MHRPDFSLGSVRCVRAVILLIALVLTGEGRSGELGGSSALRHLSLDELDSILPPGTAVLTRPTSIEEFLTELDGEPPDWSAVPYMVMGITIQDTTTGCLLSTANGMRNAKASRRY